MKTAAIAVLAALGLCACSPKPEAPADAPASAATSSAETAAVAAASDAASSVTVADTSAYLGKWTGPEATFLTIAQAGNGFKVTVQNLDGPRDFTGKAVPEGIQFVRDGTPFVIHPGDGKATGMKWLADKHDCLVVTAGEGYCRD